MEHSINCGNIKVLSYFSLFKTGVSGGAKQNYSIWHKSQYTLAKNLQYHSSTVSTSPTC